MDLYKWLWLKNNTVSLGLVRVQHHFRWNRSRSSCRMSWLATKWNRADSWSELAALLIASVGSQCTGLFDIVWPLKVHAAIAHWSRAHQISQSLRVAKSMSNMNIHEWYKWYKAIFLRVPQQKWAGSILHRGEPGRICCSETFVQVLKDFKESPPQFVMIQLWQILTGYRYLRLFI